MGAVDMKTLIPLITIVLQVSFCEALSCYDCEPSFFDAFPSCSKSSDFFGESTECSGENSVCYKAFGQFDGNQVTFRGCEEVENVVIGCKSVTISNIVEAHKCYCNSHNCNSAGAPRIHIIVPFVTVFVFLLAK